MSTAARHRTSPVDTTDPSGAVVVGVDGSGSSTDAVTWAAREAGETGRPLSLLAVLDDYRVPVPHHAVDADDERVWRMLDTEAGRARTSLPQQEVRRDVQVGGTVSTLLDRSVDQHLLVVGKRGLGAFGRMMVGSTSTGVTGRSRVPVVVVPDGWDQDTHAGAPIVLGIDPLDVAAPALRWACERASANDVALRVVHAVDFSAPMLWDPRFDGILREDWLKRRAEMLAEVLAPARQEWPDLRVQLAVGAGHPGDLLLQHAHDAQLLVVGRRPAGRLGLAIGSATRAVLHYAELPVVMVPDGA